MAPIVPWRPQAADWLPPRAVALALGRSVFTVRGWARSRMIPEQYLFVTPGGFLIHRDFLVRPFLRRLPPLDPEVGGAK